MKIPRNEPCPCLSGKKYKKCCITTQPVPLVSQASVGQAINQVDAQAIHQKCLEVLNLLDSENLDQAKLLAAELFIAHPGHDYVNFVQGLCQIKLADYAQAVACFKQAISAYPLFAEAYYHLGQAYFMQDDLENTLACLNKVLEIEAMAPQNPELLKAAQDMLAGLNEATQKEFGCSLQAHVKFVGLIKRAEACLIAGKNKKAQELLEQVIALKPDCVQAYENLAMIYYQSGQKTQAMACLSRVFTLDPARAAKYLAQDEQSAESVIAPELASQTEQQL